MEEQHSKPRIGYLLSWEHRAVLPMCDGPRRGSEHWPGLYHVWVWQIGMLVCQRCTLFVDLASEDDVTD